MSGTLTILDLPRRRAWLEWGMGAKVRDLFARNRSRALPRVEFVTPDQARARRLPQTSWYRFDEERIGIYLESLPDAAREWERLEHHTLHELLHWAWNFSVSLSGATDQIDHTLANIFADAANEQRAGLANPWARGIVARGRNLLAGDLLTASQPDDPLWAAALLTLRAHTCLAARGWEILEAFGDRDDQAAAAAVRSRIAPRIVEPQAAIATIWDRAFAVAFRAWRSSNQFDLLDAVGEFRALFPEPQSNEPPPSPFGLDAHEGEPPDGEPQPSPAAPKPQPSANGGGEPPEAPELGPQAPAGAGDDVAAELEALARPAGIWRPVVPKLRGAAREVIRPRAGADLLRSAEADGVELGRRIRATRAPRLRIRSERGRAVARIISREPDASRPFRSRTHSEPELTPDVFVAVVIDTSGSMADRGKIAAARRAAMTIAVACERAQAPYAIVTSRKAGHVGGDGIDLARTSALLAGLGATDSDGLSLTLGPILEAVSERPEPVRIAIVVQDGEPCGPAAVRSVVELHRSRGAIVVAVGLDLTEREAEGLAAVFGPSSCLTTVNRLVRDLGDGVSGAIARSVRRTA